MTTKQVFDSALRANAAKSHAFEISVHLSGSLSADVGAYLAKNSLSTAVPSKRSGRRDHFLKY
jgi:hypothetical protein